MFKLILKNLWSNRRRNGWLLAELILVTVVSWVIFDPIVVITSDFSDPIGYEPDRLCLVEVASLAPSSARYDASRDDSASIAEDMIRIVERINHRQDVECAAPLTSTYMNSSSSINTGIRLDSVNFIPVSQLQFFAGYNYFTAYGIETAEGSPSAETLSNMSYGADDIIVTQSLAGLIYPEENPIGKTIKDYAGTDYRIVGVVKDVRRYSNLRNAMVAFKAASGMEIDKRGSKVLVRVKPGVDTEAFAEEFKGWMVGELNAGNLFARKVESYTAFNDNYEFFNGGDVRRLNILLAIFFLVNLCLGVIGTFWLQTRSRSEDAGVMRSFGATPAWIMWMLIGEGVLLTTVAWLIGSIGYLQWALSEGLSIGSNWNAEMCIGGWLSDFWQHFIGVSLIVYIVIVAVVVLGVYLPARRISRVNPVDALHETN